MGKQTHVSHEFIPSIELKPSSVIVAMDPNGYTLMDGISSKLIAQPRNKFAISLSWIFDAIDFI